MNNVADMLADPLKCLAICTSKSFADETLPIHQKWYKFDYSMEKFSEERISALRQASVPADSDKRLDLPPPNTLIPTNFEILPEDASFSTTP